MIHFAKLLAIAAFTTSTAAQAQFVKGNEAVRHLPNGNKVVETPPLPKTPSSRSTPCKVGEGCHAGPWHMVETTGGLVECTEVYARPTTCRASSYGRQKRSRLWVVKVTGTWMQCQFPDLKSKCVPIFAPPPANLPYDAVQ